ncbi:fimbrial protein [Anaerotignum sp.]
MKKYRDEKKMFSVPQVCYLFFCMITMLAYMIEPVYANVTIWEKASEIMSDVYGQVVGISTIAAIVTAAIALLMMNFSRSGRTVDESRAWLKRIVITWAIINGLGFIMSYITPFFSGGTWTP